MTIYHRYTTTQRKHLYTLYKCSHCGNFVLSDVCLKDANVYTDKGTFTKASLQRKKDKAELQLESRLNDRRTGLLFAADKVMSYYKAKAKLGTPCPICKKKEPWTKFTNWFWKLASVFLYLIILALMLDSSFLFKLSSIPAIAILIWGLFTLILCIKTTRIIRSGYIPVFDTNVRKLKEKADKYSVYAGVDWKKIATAYLDMQKK
ncbi:MAG: hypothetical protein IJ041_04445 [Clostridia bacterium]|nr:hypothetical protein [Clostridia bacterium]